MFGHEKYFLLLFFIFRSALGGPVVTWISPWSLYRQKMKESRVPFANVVNTCKGKLQLYLGIFGQILAFLPLSICLCEIHWYMFVYLSTVNISLLAFGLSWTQNKRTYFQCGLVASKSGTTASSLEYCMCTLMTWVWIATQTSNFSYLSESLFGGFYLSICFAVNPGEGGLACFWEHFPVEWWFLLVVSYCEGSYRGRHGQPVQAGNRWDLSWNLLY